MTAIVSCFPLFLAIDNQETKKGVSQFTSKMKVVEWEKGRALLTHAGDYLAGVVVEHTLKKALDNGDFLYGKATHITPIEFPNANKIEGSGFVWIQTKITQKIKKTTEQGIESGWDLFYEDVLYRFELRENTGVIIFELVSNKQYITNGVQYNFLFEGSAFDIMQSALHTMYDVSPLLRPELVLPALMSAASGLDEGVGDEFKIAFNLNHYCQLHQLPYEEFYEGLRNKFQVILNGVFLLSNKDFESLKKESVSVLNFKPAMLYKLLLT